MRTESKCALGNGSGARRHGLGGHAQNQGTLRNNRPVDQAKKNTPRGTGRAFSFSRRSVDDVDSGLFVVVDVLKGCGDGGRIWDCGGGVEMECHLAQSAEDVCGAVVFEPLFVLAPEDIAAPMGAILDVPVFADGGGNALGRHVGRGQTADEEPDGERLFRAIQADGLGLEDALSVRKGGGFRLDGQNADLALFDSSVLFFYFSLPKKGRRAPGWDEAKALCTCLWRVG